MRNDRQAEPGKRGRWRTYAPIALACFVLMAGGAYLANYYGYINFAYPYLSRLEDTGPAYTKQELMEMSGVFCKDTPQTVKKEITSLIENRDHALEIGLMYKFLEKNGEVSGLGSVMLVMNKRVCRGEFCRVHIYWTSQEDTPSQSGQSCRYVFSTYLPQDKLYVRDVIAHKFEENSAECLLFYRGLCLQ